MPCCTGLTPAFLPTIRLRRFYSQFIGPNCEPDTAFSINLIGSLPPGLNFSSPGNAPARIFGTPTQIGDFTFTLTYDQTECALVSQTYTIRVRQRTNGRVGVFPVPGSGAGLADYCQSVASARESYCDIDGGYYNRDRCRDTTRQYNRDCGSGGSSLAMGGDAIACSKKCDKIKDDNKWRQCMADCTAAGTGAGLAKGYQQQQDTIAAQGGLNTGGGNRAGSGNQGR